MRGFVQREVSRILKRIREAKVQTAIATSGTPAALSGLYEAKVRGYDESKPHTVPHPAISKILKELSKRNLTERQALPGIGPRRAEIIIAGAMVFAELMDMCSLRNFRYLPLGLRDGLLAQMLADYSGSSAMKERVESERHDALLAVAKHYGVDLAFSQRIRAFTLQLFRRLQSVHRLPPQYADWLEAAAMLHEVGAYINRSGRRRHTHYIIAQLRAFRLYPGTATHHRSHLALCGQLSARRQRRSPADGSSRGSSWKCPRPSCVLQAGARPRPGTAGRSS